MTKQRIYVACLASYNNGVLHGRWIDATTDIDEMQEQIAAMLRESRFPNVMVENPDGDGEVPSAEEWAIHDHEGLGDIGEYASLETIATRVALVELADDRDIPLSVLLDFVNDYCPNGDADDIETEVDDHYAGSFTNSGDWAAEQAEEMGFTVPKWIGCHVDWEGVARDWLMDYSQYDADGETYLFRNC